jgi:hypothetical protein
LSLARVGNPSNSVMPGNRTFFCTPNASRIDPASRPNILPTDLDMDVGIR